MNKKPTKDETRLQGNWIAKKGSVVQDAVCERIQWLTDSFFQQIAVDGDNWSALYINPEDDCYWELTYPNSHMQGGGPPMLQRISATEAKKNYKDVL